jgi:hypothetical protein
LDLFETAVFLLRYMYAVHAHIYSFSISAVRCSRQSNNDRHRISYAGPKDADVDYVVDKCNCRNLVKTRFMGGRKLHDFVDLGSMDESTAIFK